MDSAIRKAEALIIPLADRDGPSSAPFRRLASLQAELFDIARRRSNYAEVTARAAQQDPPFTLDYWRLNMEGRKP